MTIYWINSLTIDYNGLAKMMISEGKYFKKNTSREYEISQLHTPYRLVAVMMNRIFGRADGRFYKIG